MAQEHARISVYDGIVGHPNAQIFNFGPEATRYIFLATSGDNDDEKFTGMIVAHNWHSYFLYENDYAILLNAVKKKYKRPDLLIVGLIGITDTMYEIFPEIRRAYWRQKKKRMPKDLKNLFQNRPK
jgi:hypothetical protein